jgi:4'-phosphopantetheinyl transferase
MIQVWRIGAATRDNARAALQVILERAAGQSVTIGHEPQGKPYLPALPNLKFSLAHGRGKALVAVAAGIEVGVDIERLRPMPDLARVAERFLPPGDAEALAETPEPDREREFFRRWTRAEALWKAAGLGLYGAGSIPAGDWHVEDIDAGPEYAAAVAANCAGFEVRIADFV